MIDRVRTGRNWVALTFDDGPSPETTPEIVQVLARHGAKATFFCVGKAAAKHPELISQLREQGHALANHSWSHQWLPELDRRERLAEIRRAEPYTLSSSMRLFRPPFGDYSYPVALDLRLFGYTVVAWDVAIRDWIEQDFQTMYAALQNKVKPGSIVLLHDTLYRYCEQDYPKRDVLIAVLDRWLAEAKDKFTFVTVPDLLTAGKALKRSVKRNPRNKDLSYT